MVDFLLPRWALVVLWASASSADDAFRDVPATDAFRDAMALWQRGVHEAVARVEAKKAAMEEEEDEESEDEEEEEAPAKKADY